MPARRWLPSLAAVALLATAAPAQQQPPAKPPQAPPPTAKAPPRKVEPLTFESLSVKPEELPADVKVVEGLPTVARQPRAYFETPSVWDLSSPEMREGLGEKGREFLRQFPVPKRKTSEAFFSFIRAECGLGKGDHATAEKGYRRALELHESREDVLDPILVWPVLDGLGGVLVMQKKLDDASTILSRAAELARAGKPKGWTQSLYNLARCEALRKRWDKAYAALKEAIDAEPSWKAKARGDTDFAEAMKRPEFHKLVAE